MSDRCPRGGYHDWVNIRETATQVTHRCSKCGAENTMPKAGRLFAAASISVAAAFILAILLLAIAVPIWAAGNVQP